MPSSRCWYGSEHRPCVRYFQTSARRLLYAKSVRKRFKLSFSFSKHWTRNLGTNQWKNNSFFHWGGNWRYYYWNWKILKRKEQSNPSSCYSSTEKSSASRIKKL